MTLHPRFLSRISIRLLAFNVLLVFLPAAGLLYLGTYEKQLLAAQERAMVQQARLLAASLSGPYGMVDPWQAESTLRHLRQRHQSRLRVVDREGSLIADSSLVGPQREPDVAAARSPDGPRNTWLYRLGALPFRLYRELLRPPTPAREVGDYYSGEKRLLGEEILTAFAGRYGASTRISGGQRSVTLFVAIPIRSRGEVVGAAVVSQSTYGILQMLYAIRLDIFRVVLASVAVAAILSLLVSTTIARPLGRLRTQALALVDGRGRLQGSFGGSRRRDEIGDLARALDELTARLRQHIGFIEGFASDVSHEFKNPLAAIRSATEILSETDDPETRRRFAAVAEHEVARMERLLSGVREITRIDAQLDEEETIPVDLAALLASIVDAYRLRCSEAVSFEMLGPGADIVVNASPDRLTQVIENILDNAVSFSPPGGRIGVEVQSNGRWVTATFDDEGPGIAPEHRQKTFERFFTYRPGAAQRTDHVGLGMPIAKAIVETYGGSIEVACDVAGASFTVRLPIGA